MNAEETQRSRYESLTNRWLPTGIENAGKGMTDLVLLSWLGRVDEDADQRGVALLVGIVGERRPGQVDDVAGNEGCLQKPGAGHSLLHEGHD